MKKILIPYGNGAKLAKVFGCKSSAVSLALNYRRNDSISTRIRKVAIEQYGGKLVEF